MQKLGFYMMQLIYVVVLFKECNKTNKKRESVVFNEMPFNISEVKDKQ